MQAPCHLDDDLTIGFLALGRLALAHLTLLLQINIPTLRLTRCIFQCECEDGIALLNGVLAIRVVRFQRVVDEVEGGR
jgi:hypothetical protein